MENNFDNYLQQQVDAGQFSPQGDDWQRFEQMLDQQPKKKRRFFFLWWGILASVLLSGALLTKNYFGQSKIVAEAVGKQDNDFKKTRPAIATTSVNSNEPEEATSDIQRLQQTKSTATASISNNVQNASEEITTNTSTAEEQRNLANSNQTNTSNTFQNSNQSNEGKIANGDVIPPAKKTKLNKSTLQSRDNNRNNKTSRAVQSASIVGQKENLSIEEQQNVANKINKVAVDDEFLKQQSEHATPSKVNDKTPYNAKQKKEVFGKKASRRSQSNSATIESNQSTDASLTTTNAASANANKSATSIPQSPNTSTPKSKHNLPEQSQQKVANLINQEIDITIIDNGFKLEKGSPLYKKLAATYGANNITKLSSEKIAAAKAQLATTTPNSNDGIFGGSDNNEIKKLKLFVLAGTNVNQGFADSVASAKQGVTPFVGIGLSKMLSNKVGLRLDVVGTTYNQVNHYKASPLYTYSFGRVADSFRLNYQKFSQIQVPLRLEYQMGKIVSLYAGGSASYLVDVGAKVQNGANAEIDQWGYRDGFNRLDIAATFGFGLHITKTISIESFYQHGFMDVTNNSFFNNTQNDLQKKVQIGIKYNFKK